MRIAAFFDMDRTLLRCNSGSRWVWYQREHRQMDTATFLRSLVWTVQYKLSILDMDTMVARLMADMTGTRESDLWEKTGRFVRRDVLPEVSPRAREALERHRRDGHLLVLLTSSTPYIAEPLAQHVSIPHVLCTRLHVQDGVFLGTVERPTCYGAGKVHHAERFAAEHGVDLDRSYFYTDSYSDLPMLQRVAERRVVNPDARLLRHARRQGWSIERW